MKSKTPARLGKQEEFKAPSIPTVDRLIFYTVLLVVFVGIIVTLSYVCGYNNVYYYNSRMIQSQCLLPAIQNTVMGVML